MRIEGNILEMILSDVQEINDVVAAIIESGKDYSFHVYDGSLHRRISFHHSYARNLMFYIIKRECEHVRRTRIKGEFIEAATVGQGIKHVGIIRRGPPKVRYTTRNRIGTPRKSTSR
jgi:hypothetical protein